MPGGTLEWGETLRDSIARELLEEAGVRTIAIGDLRAVYSRPDRDARFHAVTIVVDATVSEPDRAPVNPLEIREVRLFRDEDLPETLAHGMTDMLRDARAGGTHWE